MNCFEVLTSTNGVTSIYETEIARRFNLMVQGIGAAMATESKTSALLIYKEGILFQGGPADIFMRRVVLPDDFDPAVDNPFAYENVQCVEFADDGIVNTGRLALCGRHQPQLRARALPGTGYERFRHNHRRV